MPLSGRALMPMSVCDGSFGRWAAVFLPLTVLPDPEPGGGCEWGVGRDELDRAVAGVMSSVGMDPYAVRQRFLLPEVMLELCEVLFTAAPI